MLTILYEQSVLRAEELKERSYLGLPNQLLPTLEELSTEELRRFQLYLTGDQLPGLPPVPESQLERAGWRKTVVTPQKYSPENAVKITVGILRRMNRKDLIEKLERDHRGSTHASASTRPHSASSVGQSSILRSPSKRAEGTLERGTYLVRGLDLLEVGSARKRRRRYRPKILTGSLKKRKQEGPTMLSVPNLLLETLEKLSRVKLKRFQWHLTEDVLDKLPPIPESQLKNSDWQDTVDQIMQTYGPEKAVEITVVVLRLLYRNDLAEVLERSHRGEEEDENPYRNTHHQRTKQRGDERQRYLENWTWEEILDGKGPWAQAGEYRRPEAELEAAKAERLRYEEAARQRGWKPERQPPKCIGRGHTGSMAKSGRRPVPTSRAYRRARGTGQAPCYAVERTVSPVRVHSPVRYIATPRHGRAREGIEPGAMKQAQRIWSPVRLLWPVYMAPALRMVSPVRQHSPVRAIPPRRTGLATGSIQPDKVRQARCSRAPVRLHGPIYSVPPPHTRPLVAAPRTRLSLCLLPTGAPACPALPEPSSCPALPESPACPALQESPACPALPESPACPALPESPACPALPESPNARVPSLRSAARFAVLKRPRRRAKRRTRTMVKWGHVPRQSRHRGQIPTQTLPYRFRFCGRSPHLWGGGGVLSRSDLSSVIISLF
uniref:Pyrin domain-containing protein n=1 Tax=Oncorhynchus mykiss TaxID=8022 RepID=A0A8K9UVX3_ONCMY